MDSVETAVDSEVAEDTPAVARGNGQAMVSPALVVLTDPNGIEAEAVRGLRTRIVAQHINEGRRSLAVCAPSAEADSAFVAANLAASMAQIGVKTILVDANLRESVVGSLFGIAPEAAGLSNYLAGTDTGLEKFIYSGVASNLSVMPAGPLPANPQELLSSPRFPMLVNQLLREFDLTIFDTAPAHSCTDAQRVATVVGYALIVARKDESYINDVKILSQTLRADRSVVIGAVLNDY